MNRKLTYLVLAAIISVPAASGQTARITPEGYLLLLPAPAVDAREAIARCPQEVDTSLQKIQKELSLRADNDTVDMLAVDRQLRAQTQFFSKVQKEFQLEIFAVGEQVDAEIRACAKTLDDKGQSVYDQECVEAAEELGRRRRLGAVDQFLSQIRQVWPEYMRETRNIVTGAGGGKWLIVLRAAANAATITQTGAQFAR